MPDQQQPEPEYIVTESGTTLERSAHGWAEVPRPACGGCGLVWPWDGTLG